MEEIKEKKVKSKTSAKSKSANSVKTVSKKETEGEEKNIKKSANNKQPQTTLKVPKEKTKEKEKETIKEKETTKAKEQIKAKKQIKVENLKLDLDEEIEELEVEEINIEQIQLEIEQHNKITPEESQKIKRKIIPNIVIALILTIFYIFIELGFKNIETKNYILDLKVFSGIFLAIAIYLFEKSYKTEDSGKALYGIEMLITSIFNFALVYIYYAKFAKYEIIVFAFAIATNVYYIAKSIILYIKKKKEYFFEKSDIKEITSKQTKKKEGI